MKYPVKQPRATYTVLPVFATVLSSLIVFPIAFAISGDDLSRMAALYIFVGQYAFFLSWTLYANRFNDYIELSDGDIKWGFDQRRKKPDIEVATKDILLFEIIFIEQPGPDFCVIHIRDGSEQQIECGYIPGSDIEAFCKQNNIVPRRVVLKNRDIEEVTVTKKKISIKYYDRKRKLPIPVSTITSIDLVTLHPLSRIDKYYVVHTTNSSQYEFSFHDVEHDKMLRFTTEIGRTLRNVQNFSTDDGGPDKTKIFGTDQRDTEL